MISPSPMSDSNIPLPERLRPRDLSEIIGQDHLLGERAPLRQMIDQGHLPSIIFWGPPGMGKTTIALLLAQAIDRPFVSLSALTPLAINLSLNRIKIDDLPLRRTPVMIFTNGLSIKFSSCAM